MSKGWLKKCNNEYGARWIRGDSGILWLLPDPLLFISGKIFNWRLILLFYSVLFFWYTSSAHRDRDRTFHMLDTQWMDLKHIIFYSSYFCSWVKYKTTLSNHSRQRSERENQTSSFAFSFKDSGTSVFTRYRLHFGFFHCGHT